MDVKRKNIKDDLELFHLGENKKGEFDFKYGDFQVVMSQQANISSNCRYNNIEIGTELMYSFLGQL